jgi:hypothetical protein
VCLGIEIKTNTERERAKCICQGITCNLSFYLGLTSAEVEKLEYYNGTAHFKNVNYCLNTNIYAYLETSGGQNYGLYLNIIHFLNISLNSVAA